MKDLQDFELVDSSYEFPLILKPRQNGSGFQSLLADHKDAIESYLKEYGAVMFKGLGIQGIEDFNRAASTFGSLIDYKERSSPRRSVADKIYTSTDHPADQVINMHNENSYSRSWPLKIAFYCLKPSISGGETPLADSRRVLKMLSEKTKAKFIERGVKYIRNLNTSLGLDWQAVFQTADKRKVEDYCLTNEIDFEWLGNDRLRLTYATPAVRKHPQTGELVWFNHAFFFNLYSLPADFVEDILTVMSLDEFAFLSYYGDGSEIELEVIEEIRSIYNTISVKPKWEKGDFVLVDNMLTAHGRNSYTGDRKILVAMMEPQHYKDYAEKALAY